MKADAPGAPSPRPNILVCISDDQSYWHTGVAGDPVVKTPAFDRIAREGVFFRNAYCSSPSCTASRAAILTGRPFFQLEEGANLRGALPAKFETYPDLLEKAGYAIGVTGTGSGPGEFAPGGRTRDPAGPEFPSFAKFRSRVPDVQPWCFWFGSREPSRPYPPGGRKSGKALADIRVPAFLPDAPVVREDLADYLSAIERFDKEVGDILQQLEERGELDRTLVVVTSDNGMPFPRAKANLYDAGTRVPLAICWPERASSCRVVDDFVSLTELAPTFLEAAGVERPPDMSRGSLTPLLVASRSSRIDDARDHVFFGRERHALSRPNGLGYPARAVRTHDYLYIRNLAPERWPAGDPATPQDSEVTGTCGDIDDGPTRTFLLQCDEPDPGAHLRGLATDKRPEEELYDLGKDPDELVSVAGRPEYMEIQHQLRIQLDEWMKGMKDPRLNEAAPFDAYPYFGEKRGRVK